MIKHAFSSGRPGLIVLALVFAGGVWASAQQRRPAPAEPEPVIAIRRIEGVGPRARVPTPQYRTSVPQGRASVGQWGQITVTYDTAPEWIDELTLRYYALLAREERGEPPAYELFRGTVTYIEIPRGRAKESTAFLRPNTLQRHGNVIAVAVEALHEGRTVAVLSQELPRSVAEGREGWWRNPNLAPRDGYILNRAQTPFALIDMDQYETIRQ